MPTESYSSNPDSRKTRITILTSIHHEVYGHEAQSALRTPYVEHLSNTEQAYERVASVGIDWKPLDFGWTKETGCAFANVKNVFKSDRRVEPTDDEREYDAKHILEIGKQIDPQFLKGEIYIEPVYVLYVGQEIVFSPLGSLDRWMVRCVVDAGRYYMFSVPNDPE